MGESWTMFAVVTGASSGIGLELAKQFAGHGFDVMAVAENDELAEAASAIGACGGEVMQVQVDLATPEGVRALHAQIVATGRAVDALALNAGVGVAGEFVTTSLEADLNLIGLNIMSPVHLAKLVLPDMVRRGEGRVLGTASVASTMPGPYLLMK